MPEMIENAMLVDPWWDEREYVVPNRHRLEQMRKAYDEAEMEELEHE